MSAKLIIVNPTEREYTDQRFVLSFGAYGCIHLMVWGHLEDALEEAAKWLAENAPGHIMLKGNGADERDPYLDELLEETCKKKGLAWPIPNDAWGTKAMEPYWDAESEAYADLTETEDGYLTSYEWCITLDNPTRAEVKAFIAELSERHYDSGPVVDVTRPRSDSHAS